ncbi:MAG: hypothetical protein HZB44_03515 [Actinobacteria bacterium]|nr:hypothetical protein [Actinomycetota bacterium]
MELGSTIFKFTIGPVINLLPFIPSKKKRKLIERLELVRKTVCFNQGALAQYSFVAGEKHRVIKDQLRNQEHSQIDIAKLQEDFEKLTDFINWDLWGAAKRNFEFIHEYFAGYSKFRPCMCIKVSFNDEIIEIFRDFEGISSTVSRHPIESNVGISEANELGSYYLCNNIPKEVRKEGGYRNARLNHERASQYRSFFLKDFFFNITGRQDKKWVNCWKEMEGSDEKMHKQPAETCYKSTLIIPMTLRNNELSWEYRNLWGLNNREGARAIFGFLCIANHKKNYFNKNTDISMGYALADLLSLYLIERLTYTSHSRTYSDVEQMLEMATEKAD